MFSNSNWDEEVPALTSDQQIEALKRVIESVQGFALWITIALAVLLIITGIIIKLKFSDKFRGFLLLCFGITIGYSITILCIGLFLGISLSVIKGDITPYFYVIVGLVAYMILAVTASVLVKIFAKKAFLPVFWSALIVFFAYIATILCVFPTDSETQPINSTAFIISTIVLVAAILLLTIFFDRKKGSAPQTKQLAYAGICIATAFALSYVKFISLPVGGSVTLVSMLPLMLFAYMFGAKKGLMAGIIYGLLQLIQSPQIYQPVQVLLDYPIAFGALGLAGIFRGMKGLKGNMLLEFVLGMVVACVFRYVSHVISGTFVFHYGAPWLDAFVYSLGYNAFVFVDLALDVLVGAALLSSKTMQKQIAAVNFAEE